MLDSIYSDQHGWEPFLNLKSATTTKITIRSIDLLRYRDTYLVRTESEDGAVGIAMTNSRCKFLYPMPAAMRASASNSPSQSTKSLAFNWSTGNSRGAP
jgi:hypothetical protein